MTKFNFSSHLSDQRAIIAFVSFVSAIIISAVFFWPKFQEMRVVRERIEVKKLELQGREEYLAKLYLIEAQLKEREEDFSKIKSALPEDPSVPSLFNYFQKTASQSGMILEKIGSFVVSPSQAFPELQETVFSVQTSGSYSSFKNFLLTLERSARLIEIESISFSSKEEAEAFSFSLRIKTFSY